MTAAEAKVVQQTPPKTNPYPKEKMDREKNKAISRDSPAIFGWIMLGHSELRRTRSMVMAPKWLANHFTRFPWQWQLPPDLGRTVGSFGRALGSLEALLLEFHCLCLMMVRTWPGSALNYSSSVFNMACKHGRGCSHSAYAQTSPTRERAILSTRQACHNKGLQRFTRFNRHVG